MHEDIVDENNILQRASYWREKPIACILKLDNMYGKEKGRLLYKCIPYNKHLPVFLVPYEEKKKFSKKRVHKYVLIKYKHWNDKHPIGILTQTFGNIDNLSCLYDYLLFALDIHTSNQRFTKQFVIMYKQYTKQQHITTMKDKYKLEDRLSYSIITIDGETTQDFDDAIGYVKKGDVEILSIYISNPVLWMDHFDLWNEYGDRTSSIYLPDRVVNMLPNMMGTKVASLVEGEQSVAFVMDIYIRGSSIECITYKNVIISVDHNYRYEEDKLLNNGIYKSIVGLLTSINKSVENSYKCIEVLMIYFNSTIGEELSRYNRGIYRYCTIKEINDKKVPEDLQNYMSWQDTRSDYSLYDPNLSHMILGVTYYTQMSSPIRRVVDIINMIEIQIINGMCVLTEHTIEYKKEWLTRLELINKNHRSIRALESETKLLNYYMSTSNVEEEVHEVYVVLQIDEYKYKLYVPKLKATGILKVIETIPLYTKIYCKLCLIQDDINIVQKIRFIKVSST